VSPTVRAYVEDELVTATGFRTSAVLAEALTVPGFTSEVLSGLVNKRVVRVIERANGKWLELTHDILTEIAVASRKLRYERQRAQDELEQERHDKERRDLRKTRRWLTGVVVALSMAVAGWLLAIRTGRAAARAADEAEQQRQVAQRAQQDERRQKDIAEQARQDERRQKDIAERAERDAINERDKAATTLAVFQHNQQIRQAALSASGNNLSRAEYNKQLVTLLSDNRASTIKFTVEARDQKWKDGQGREIYDFWLSPRRDSLEAGEVAFITYFADHPTFNRTLMVSGPDRGFRVTYTGWGCLTRIVAVIEFTKPVPIAVAEFDMCKILGWN
jgi:hypothetical protein